MPNYEKLEKKPQNPFGIEVSRYFKEICSYCDNKRLCYRIKGTNDFVCRNCADKHF